MIDFSILSDKSLLLVFAHTPAGLGHLRVTDALAHGLPKEITSIILGSDDPTAARLHRIMSIHPVSRMVMEWAQRGTPEDIFTFFHRVLLLKGSTRLYQQILTLLQQRLEKVQTLLVVSTHFGLAHQLATIKQRLAQEQGLNVVLVLQVTDDSPQHIWYVPGADLVFVPSETTKQELIHYGKTHHLPPITIEVIPYPVSPELGYSLNKKAFLNRVNQLTPGMRDPIHVAIPISGAAVGTDFFLTLIKELHHKSHRYIFHIIARTAPYTIAFLENLESKDYVKLYTGISDREVVNHYEYVYQHFPISLEVTKPSEQTFKALFSPTQVGGSLLLFAKPVGRQEYDNLKFLSRHHLIPQEQEQEYLMHKVRNKLTLETERGGELLTQVSHWRGIPIPDKPLLAADFIEFLLEQGVFTQMMNCKVYPGHSDPHAHELRPDGVEEFWKRVATLVRHTQKITT